ncbi:MAG: hypothetical protein IPL08_13465 [Saprospiraceae bacterium]|nr:hypothetical protein [Saprospiraceae bacterium]
MEKDRKSLLESDQLRVETVESRKENLNKAFSFLNYFLNLVAIVALLLGCIGVASSVMIYVRSKTNSIALLRCLGMKPMDAFLVYFIQIVALGLIGVIMGVLTGVLIQSALPVILKDFIPVTVNNALSSKSHFRRIFPGDFCDHLICITTLGKYPQYQSFLRTLRVETEASSGAFDYLKTGILVIIGIVLIGFLWLLTSSFLTSLAFVAGIIVYYLILSGLSSLIITMLRKSIPFQCWFCHRQGLSNLFRPDNQTQTIMVTIGMGTAVLTTLMILQSLLLNNVSMMDAGKQPNMILYGIETNQMDDLKKLTLASGLPVIQEVPVVTMKIDGWKGRTKAQWLADSL